MSKCSLKYVYGWQEDSDAYAVQADLLTPRTVQAHCTYLTESDLDLVHKTGTAIAHCPLSNVYFSARPFKLREALHAQVPVGLGTDIAGGYSADIMSAMRQAVIVSRMRENDKVVAKSGKEDGKENLAISWNEALYLATRGGAIALRLPEGTGIFAVGAPFDAQQSRFSTLYIPSFALMDRIVNVYDPTTGAGIGPLDFFDTPAGIEEEMIEKWWCVGDTRNRSAVWVQGTRLQQNL